MQYLLSIAIGPVQEFIATARRSRDLWFGSWLLSELSKAAAHAIINQPDNNKESLIFPAIDDPNDLIPGSTFNVVNKITAVIQADDIKEFTGKIKDAVEQQLDELRGSAFGQIKDGEIYFDVVRAKLQVDDLLEFYCVALPLLDPLAYTKVRTQSELLLAARRNTRNFKSAGEWAREGVPKSSLDGLRESVIRQDAEAHSDETRRQWFGTRPGERLCGVGLLKRLGNRKGGEGFFSTSHVAALPLLSNLQETHGDDVRQYFDKLKEIDQSAWSKVSGNGSSPIHQRIARVFRKKENHPCDGRLLFEDRLVEYFEKKNVPLEVRKTKINNAKAALRNFLKSALGDRQPFPYYALLLADGDGMGKAIEELTLPDKHRELSSRLSAFAKGVRETIETMHHGSLIYAGGDDVLAFVPAHQIVQCAKALSDAFRTAMNHGQGKSPTLSIGVAICHHLDPLSDALTLAREAEREAKRFPGKNALCLKLNKRGGETTTVVDRWAGLDERLGFFTLLFVADKLPDGVAYEFQRLADQLRDVPDAVPGEVKRILKRKRAGHGEEEVDKNVIVKIEDVLKELGKTKDAKTTLKWLSEELIVARALAAAQEQSYPNQEAAKDAARQELMEMPNGGDNANLDN